MSEWLLLQAYLTFVEGEIAIDVSKIGMKVKKWWQLALEKLGSWVAKG